MSIERISTLGERHQITVPKEIRERAGIEEKTLVYIQASETGDSLELTFKPPETGVYNRVRLSEKGQLVIPKNLRESKEIRIGTNLAFSAVNGGIRICKLPEDSSNAGGTSHWEFLLSLVMVLKRIDGLESTCIEDRSLVMTTGNDGIPRTTLTILSELEKLTGTRLVVEKNGKMLKLHPANELEEKSKY